MPRRVIHGGRRTRLYQCWADMIKRCHRPKTWNYARYGGRGIQVCPEWQDFSRFREWALGHGYQEGLTIERVDNNGDYSPENCRWVTMAAQTRNRRSNHPVTAWGETKLLVEWAEDLRCQVSYDCLKQRLNKIGWPPEIAISTPPQPGKRFA